jgi:hypothetical protein
MDGVPATANLQAAHAPGRVRIAVATLVSLAIYLALVASVAINAWSRPIANWDMLAYSGAVIQRQGETDPALIQQRAYQSVRAAVSDDQWTDLTTAGRYRVVQATNPDAFVSMLPMYAVKGGYITLISVLSHASDIVRAMRLVSFVSVLALLALLPLAFWKLGALRFLGLTAPVLASLGIVDLASLATPDALVAALATGAMVAIVLSQGRGAMLVAVALLVTAVWMRPDMLVATTGLPLALVVGHWLGGFREGRGLITGLIAAVRQVGIVPWLGVGGGAAAYMLAKWGVAHPGWWAHFNFTFVAQQETMAGFQPPFDPQVYVTTLARVTVRLLRAEIWPWLVMAGLLVGLLFARLKDVSGLAFGLFLFGAGMFAARYIAFPLPDARVAVPAMIALLLAAAALVRNPKP